MSEEELEALLGIGCCEYHRDIGIEAKKEIERLNNIINKAIEYIEKSKLNQLDTYCKYLYIDFDTGTIENFDKLLDILKGADKE